MFKIISTTEPIRTRGIIYKRPLRTARMIVFLDPLETIDGSLSGLKLLTVRIFTADLLLFITTPFYENVCLYSSVLSFWGKWRLIQRLLRLFTLDSVDMSGNDYCVRGD